MIMNCFLINMVNIIVNFHYSSLVTTSVTIVGCREYSYHRSIVLPLIPLHNKLMRPCNEVKIINMGKLFCNILSKRVPCTSWWYSPATPTHMSRKMRLSMLWFNIKYHKTRRRVILLAPRASHTYTHLSSGSDQTRSHIGPSWGTSCTRSKSLAWSRVSIEGERPPWRQKIRSATTAVMGR